jgi:hypothetical protein
VAPRSAHRKERSLSPRRVDRRLLALAFVAFGSVAACGPQVVTPTPPSGVRPDPDGLGSVPRPGLSTAVGTSGPGVDGADDFFSFTSQLSPESTIAAYAQQLVGAGFSDAGRIGAWRVFTDPSLTLWVRVGSGGPPTSLIVRVAPTSDDVADGPFRPTASDQAGSAQPDPSGGVGDAGPKASNRPAISSRRPDPPHASPRTGGVGSAGSGSSGGTPTGTGATGGTGSGGTPVATAPAGTGTSGGGSGTGTGIGGGSGSRP